MPTQPPRRSGAQFTAENDHNPLILQDCPACHGSGKRGYRSVSESGAQIHTLKLCEDCHGSGTTGQIERYFLKELPIKDAFVDADGWLRCPECGVVFTTRDPNRWTGYRHITCGQRIILNTNTAEQGAAANP